MEIDFRKSFDETINEGYSHLDDDNISISYEIFEKDTDIQIGYVEGNLGKEFELISVVNIFDKYKKKGIGLKAFLKVYNEIGGKERVKGILGSWHSGGEFNHLPNNMSTNLFLFKKHIDDGYSEEESAKLTVTGKWAKDLGFPNVSIQSHTNENATVLFY